MAKKSPRRTAERIMEVTQDQFNRFGEPDVSPKLISAKLGVRTVNLYYHYASKDELINALFERYQHALHALVDRSSDGARHVKDAWFFMHKLFELIWQHHFFYRDLNNLLSKNRWLETDFQGVLKHKTRAAKTLLDGMRSVSTLTIDCREMQAIATSRVVRLTYWLSFEYVRDPRHALEPVNAQAALLAGWLPCTEFDTLPGARPVPTFASTGHLLQEPGKSPHLTRGQLPHNIQKLKRGDKQHGQVDTLCAHRCLRI